MDYSAEEIYELVGKQDKAAGVTFKPGSEPHELYGSFVTVQFLYTQWEREALDKRLDHPPEPTATRLKAKHLYSDLPADKIERLEREGILTGDIANIAYSVRNEKNTFHSPEKRTLNKINLTIRPEPKGQDYEWMYGLAKRFVEEGVGLTPKERAAYLAKKLYFEPGAITVGEEEEIFPGGLANPDVEWAYLNMRYLRKEATPDDIRKAVWLMRKQDAAKIELLEKYLNQNGTSLYRLMKENPEMAARLWQKVAVYQERRFNLMGKVPIYLDLDRYLHVSLRHVEEMQVNNKFVGKTNFQLEEQDVRIVIDNVIEQINPDVQDFFERHPDQPYSRTGKHSIYFEGDYYSVFIEPDGRISTFFKVRKAHEQTA